VVEVAKVAAKLVEDECQGAGQMLALEAGVSVGDGDVADPAGRPARR
jgi:hypothetical protein